MKKIVFPRNLLRKKTEIYLRIDLVKLMSISIPLSLLQEDGENRQIKKLLTIKSEKKEKFKSFQQKYQEKITIVHMYLIKEGLVYLPYKFTRSYFSGKEKYIEFLGKKKYPKLFEGKREDKFIGELRDYQVEVFEEARGYLKREKTVTLALNTGFGKTFLGSMFSWYLNSYTLVLVHLNTVAKSWLKTYQAYLKLNDDEIIMVDDKLIKKPEKAEKGKIFICMYGRVDKIPEKIKKKIRLLIIDEAHCFGTSSRVPGMLSTQPEYIIVETATPERPDGLEKVVQTVAGTHFIERKNKKPFKFYLIQTKIPFETEGSWTELLSQQMKSEERNKIFFDLIERHPHYKTMIIANRKEHCGILEDGLSRRSIESSKLYGTMKKYDATRNVLIGTGSKMGTGFDEKRYSDVEIKPSKVLFITYSFKEKGPFLQAIGRVFRIDNPIIIMLCDDNSIVKRHFREIKKWVVENSGEVIVVKKKDIPKLNL
jgi:hypothetical protein